MPPPAPSPDLGGVSGRGQGTPGFPKQRTAVERLAGQAPERQSPSWITPSSLQGRHFHCSCAELRRVGDGGPAGQPVLR